MKNIVFSPFSNELKNGKKNPKNYPYWQEVISILVKKDIRIIQLGVGNQFKFNNCHYFWNKNFGEIVKIMRDSDSFMCVDTFLHHLGNRLGKRGVVVFSQSDPLLFGHKSNTNLLKDRKYLRTDQFSIWEFAEYDEEAYVAPGLVAEEVLNIVYKG